MNVLALLSVVLLVVFNQVDVASSFAWWVIDRRALVLFARPDSTLTRFVSRSPPQEALRRSRGVRIGIPLRQALVRCAVQFVRRQSSAGPSTGRPTPKHRQAPTSSKRELLTSTPFLLSLRRAFIEKTYPGQTSKAQVMIDIGFLVTTKHDVEDDKANVDYGVYGPSNALLTSEQGVSEGEIDLHTAAEAAGPYKLCVRVSGGKLLRPSVIVDISYFSVFYDGDDMGLDLHDSSDEKGDMKETLATHEQIEDIELGLAKLDRFLHNVTSETRFLYARTLRHLRTSESTLSRTKWYYATLYSFIIVASVVQIMVIRFLFRKSQRGGLMML